MLTMTIQGAPQTGLGIFSADAFTCRQVAGNYICRPRTQPARTAYETLQRTIKAIAAQLTAGGAIEVPRDMTTLDVDGVIGKITTLGVQVIATAFAAQFEPPPEVATVNERGISGAEAVQRVARYAVEINEWFIFVSTNYPDVTKPKPEVVKQIQKQIVETVIYRDVVKQFRPVGAIVIGTGLLTIMGLTAAAIVVNRRRKKR